MTCIPQDPCSHNIRYLDENWTVKIRLDSQNRVRVMASVRHRVSVRLRVSVRVRVSSYDCSDYDCTDYDCPGYDRSPNIHTHVHM